MEVDTLRLFLMFELKSNQLEILMNFIYLWQALNSSASYHMYFHALEKQHRKNPDETGKYINGTIREHTRMNLYSIMTTVKNWYPT